MLLTQRLPIVILALAIALLAIPEHPAAHGEDEDPLPPEAWVGPEECAICHPSAYDAWRDSTHASTLQEARAHTLPAAVLAGGTVEHAPGRTTFSVEGEGEAARYFAETLGADGTPQRFPVTHVVGKRRVHMYLTTLPDGRWQVLPSMQIEDGPFFDYTQLVFGGPDADPDVAPIVAPGDASFWSGPVRAFDARCSRCHVSGRRIAKAEDPDQRPTLSWRALGVDCEACHGPGADHAAHHGGLGGEDTMPSMLSLSRDQSLGLCLRCHLEGEVVDPDMRTGDDLFEHLSPTLLDDAARIDPYGRPVELVYDGLPFLASRCATEGEMTCTTCHDAHGSPHRGMMHEDSSSSAICASCHQEIAANVRAHSHHPSDAPGGRCVDCHMPGLVIERGHGVVTDHSISIPRFGARGDRVAENACTWCHAGRRGAPAGAPPVPADALEARHSTWWPDAQDPAPWMQVIARAREGIPDAKDAAALAALIDDATAPRVYRATAPRILAWMGEDARATLLAAAGAEDSLIRREAVGALEELRGEDVDAALRTALEDPSWPVRSRAARAALAGWARLKENEALQAPVLRALQADATAVPDDDLRWFRLGAAREITGDRAGAIEAYARQVALDPFAHGIRRHLQTLRDAQDEQSAGDR